MAACREGERLHRCLLGEGLCLGQLAEPAEGLFRRLEAVLAALLEEAVDEGLERGGRGGAAGEHAEGRRRVAEVHGGDAKGVVVEEGGAATQALVEEDTERVEVRARVDLHGLDLLGRHVLRGSEDGACLGEVGALAGCRLLGEAEVDETGDLLAVLAGHQHDVVGLEIPVDEAPLVGGAEAAGDLGDDGQRRLRGEAAGALREASSERLALEELHGHVTERLDAVLAAAVVEDGDDVGVVDLGREARFAEEALLAQGVAAVGLVVREGVADGGDLERDEAPERCVLRLEDGAHAAFSEDPKDAVPITDDVTGREQLEHGGRSSRRRAMVIFFQLQLLGMKRPPAEASQAETVCGLGTSLSGEVRRGGRSGVAQGRGRVCARARRTFANGGRGGETGQTPRKIEGERGARALRTAPRGPNP